LARSSKSGYSGTPLFKKLGFKPGSTVALIAAPGFMSGVVAAAGAKAKIAPTARAVKSPMGAIHVFADAAADLKAALPQLMRALDRDGMIWVSWPKKASRVPTDITEDVIRKLALPLGLVDVKVCAVDEVWSGLKLMIRKAKR
jgi:hypothetical protein